jgi:hypothetical protein
MPEPALAPSPPARECADKALLVRGWRKGCLPALALLATDPGWVLDLLGKDQTLTGRTDLWPLVIDSIAERPMLDWGYRAFSSPF